jgi:hypothetical protein
MNTRRSARNQEQRVPAWYLMFDAEIDRAYPNVNEATRAIMKRDAANYRIKQAKHKEPTR